MERAEETCVGVSERSRAWGGLRRALVVVVRCESFVIALCVAFPLKGQRSAIPSYFA